MTNQGRGRENSNSNIGQTLDQLIVKLSLDKSNPTSDISSMWPRDHFSFVIGKSEGVRKALMVHKNNFSWIQNFTVSYTGTCSNSAFTKLLLRFCLPITYQDYFTRYLKSALHSSRTKANQIFAYLEFPTMTKLMNST